MFSKNHRSFWRLGILLFVLCITTSPLKAQKITPSTVYQLTEDVIMQLNRMHEANFNTPDLSKVRLEIPNRLPRHVIQQALNIRLKIRTLKQINGLELPLIEAPEVREVTPADVFGVVETILMELTAFDSEFGLSPFQRSAPFVEGKTPTDVYKNLLKIQTLVEQLGIPPTVPNDVFNVAMLVSSELEKIQISVGNTDMISTSFNSAGKKPSDAFMAGYEVLSLLSELSQRDGFQIPKGVILPERLNSGITPADVQQILLYCLAEISSLKVVTGASEPMVLPAPAGGQTPSSVFDQINVSIDQLKALLNQGVTSS